MSDSLFVAQAATILVRREITKVFVWKTAAMWNLKATVRHVYTSRNFRAKNSNGEHDQISLIRQPDSWRPIVRGTIGTYSSDDISVWIEIGNNGFIEVGQEIVSKKREAPQFYIDWLLAVLCCGIDNVELIRTLSGAVSLEYALELEVVVGVPSAHLFQGRQNYSWSCGSGSISKGQHPLPMYSVGSSDEFSTLVSIVQQDVWDLTGQERSGLLQVEI